LLKHSLGDLAKIAEQHCICLAAGHMYSPSVNSRVSLSQEEQETVYDGPLNLRSKSSQTVRYPVHVVQIKALVRQIHSL